MDGFKWKEQCWISCTYNWSTRVSMLWLIYRQKVSGLLSINAKHKLITRLLKYLNAEIQSVWVYRKESFGKLINVDNTPLMTSSSLVITLDSFIIADPCVHVVCVWSVPWFKNSSRIRNIVVNMKCLVNVKEMVKWQIYHNQHCFEVRKVATHLFHTLLYNPRNLN